MARAAAKRRPPVRHHDDRRKHKDAGGQRFEDTLFFNRLRKQAKWVFVFLALVFGLGFVVFGVGSSGVSGLSDIFNGIRGGGGGTSVSKALKATQQHPKSVKAWQDLGTAYDTKQDRKNAIDAWTQCTQVAPKNVDCLTQLSADLSAQRDEERNAAQAAQIEAQSQTSTTFGPPASTPLGKAYGSVPNPIAGAISSSAGQQASAAFQVYASTLKTLEGVYARIAALEPTNANDQILVGDTAAEAGDVAVAIASYEKFIKLAPYDNQVPYAKQQIKTLRRQQAALPSAPQG